jgi:hypothetical protein
MFGINPKIYFQVIAYNNSGGILSIRNSDVLLELKGYTSWEGSKKSLPVQFTTPFAKLEISAIVKDVGTIIDADISPGTYTIWTGSILAGKSGSEVLEYTTGKSKVSYNYEFVKM